MKVNKMKYRKHITYNGCTWIESYDPLNNFKIAFHIVLDENEQPVRVEFEIWDRHKDKLVKTVKALSEINTEITNYLQDLLSIAS